MAQLGQAFDPNSVAPAEDFSPIPADEYKVMIIDSDMKATKDGTGQYLELTEQVLEGPYKGRLIWDRLNLMNKSTKAEEIAQRTLSAICHATGVVGMVQDSQQLHNIPMLAKVSYVPEKDGYSAKNEVKAYKAAAGTTQQQAATTQKQPAAQPQQQGQTPDQAATDASAPPWMNKTAA